MAKALQRYPTKELLIKLCLFGVKEFLMLISRVSKIKLMPGHHFRRQNKKERDKKKPKHVVVVEKHVRQLGEKSNRRIISRLDGTAVFGREHGRERVWGRFWFFLSFSFFGSLLCFESALMFGMKNNGHIFCPFRIF